MTEIVGISDPGPLIGCHQEPAMMTQVLTMTTTQRFPPHDASFFVLRGHHTTAEEAENVSQAGKKGLKIKVFKNRSNMYYTTQPWEKWPIE